MIFNKVNEYLFEIFKSEEKNNFNIYKADKFSTTIGGFICDNNDSYLVNKTSNYIGIKISDNKYLFTQKRNKFINEKRFKSFIENDSDFNSEEYKNKFKDVDFVEIFESDKKTGEITELSYLVNKSSYLLIKYKNINKNNCISASISKVALLGSSLQKLGLDSPANENFDICKMSNKFEILVPTIQHYIFAMYYKNREIKNLDLRAKFIKSLYSYVLNADRNFYMVKNDLEDCIEQVKSNIEKSYGGNTIEGR